MKKLLALCALVSTPVFAAPPCFWGIPNTTWESSRLVMGQTADIYWIGWVCTPKTPTALLTPQWVFLAGNGSLGTFGTRLQAIRLDPTKAPLYWDTYVKLDGVKTYPAAYAAFQEKLRGTK